MSTSFRLPSNTPSSRPSDNNSTPANIKPPKAPERPLVPYMRFSRKMWQKVRAENPDAQLWDIGKVIGQLWRETADADKQVFQQEYETEKVEYEKAMKQYQSSPAYQQYLAARSRQKQTEKMSRNRTMDAGGVVIQPVDEDENHNDMTAKKVAHARYERNQRLLAELFNPQMVTDTRSIVGQSRIEMLRKQGQSLASHQAKLEEELKRLDETFEAKKRQIEKGSEEFAETLKKVCEERPVIEETKFQELVAEWEGKLKDAYVDYKKKQDEIEERLEAERAERASLEKSTLFAMVAAGEDETEKTVVKEEEGQEGAAGAEAVADSTADTEPKAETASAEENKTTDNEPIVASETPKENEVAAAPPASEEQMDTSEAPAAPKEETLTAAPESTEAADAAVAVGTAPEAQ